MQSTKVDESMEVFATKLALTMGRSMSLTFHLPLSCANPEDSHLPTQARIANVNPGTAPHMSVCSLNFG